MLPSFRLIAATFFCSFLVVFAGLRMAASLNDFHEGLPVMAANAAAEPAPPAADREMRRGFSAVPVMYDLRFAVSTVSPTLVRIAPPVLDRPAPPQMLLPAEDAARETSLSADPAPEPVQPEVTVAAVQPDTPVAAPAAPDTTAEIPAPPARTAAIDPQAARPPGTEEPLANSELDMAAIEAPADPATAPNPDAPLVASPAPKPQAAKSAPRARAKIAHKKRIRTARRAGPANSSGNSSGGFDAAPGNPPQ